MSHYKPNLETFSDRKDVVYVVSMFNEIEDSLTRILIAEIGAPKEKETFLKDILFNNAILPFNGKVKLFLHLRAANGWPKIDPAAFHRLMHIRNQFAHSQRSLHVTLQIDQAKNESSIVGEKIMMNSITGSGQLIAVDVAEALDEFTQLSVKISEYFRELNKETLPQGFG